MTYPKNRRLIGVSMGLLVFIIAILAGGSTAAHNEFDVIHATQEDEHPVTLNIPADNIADWTFPADRAIHEYLDNGGTYTVHSVDMTPAQYDLLEDLSKPMPSYDAYLNRVEAVDTKVRKAALAAANWMKTSNVGKFRQNVRLITKQYTDLLKWQNARTPNECYATEWDTNKDWVKKNIAAWKNVDKQFGDRNWNAALKAVKKGTRLYGNYVDWYSNKWSDCQ